MPSRPPLLLVGSSSWGGTVSCSELHQHADGTGTPLWGEEEGVRLNTPPNKNRMCVLQTSPARGRDWDGGPRHCLCLWFLSQAYQPGEYSSHYCWAHLGKMRLPSFHAAQRGPHAKESMPPGTVLKPDQPSKPWILNESCFEGQIPQACILSTRCALGSQTVPLHHPSGEETEKT